MNACNVIFLHVPKAAGSTLSRIIPRQYSAEKVHTISTTPSVRASIAAFRDKSRKERRRIRCVVGHAPFGLHDALVGPTWYVTLLRDPIERVISNYYYVRRFSVHRLHDTMHARGWSLREYVVESGNSALENGMTRQIAGHAKGSVTDAMLDCAVAHVDEHFAVAGVVERFDASLLLMKRRLGWLSVYYHRRNVTKGRPGKADLPEETLRVIRSKNRFDLKLYRQVRSTLDAELEQIDLSLDRRVLQLECTAHEAYRTLRDTASRLLPPLRSE